MTYINGKVYLAKWDTGTTSPEDNPIPKSWNPKFIPLN
jgi:hypothetical protein